MITSAVSGEGQGTNTRHSARGSLPSAAGTPVVLGPSAILASLDRLMLCACACAAQVTIEGVGRGKLDS